MLNSEKASHIDSVGIIGAGWVGLALAQHLKQQGVKVIATSTTIEGVKKLQQQGITACCLDLPDITDNLEVFQCQHLFICIPPGIRYGKSNYPEKIHALVKQAEQRDMHSITLLSTTAVYNDLSGKVNEDSELALYSEKTKILHNAENMVLNSSINNRTVVRLGGLIGYDRQPGRFFINGRTIPNPESVINFIHRDDVVGVLMALYHKYVSQPFLMAKIFNAVAPSHPTRRDFYQLALNTLALGPGHFAQQTEHHGKQVNCDYLNELSFNFKYPDIMSYLVEREDK